jgi:hypothetical protein
MTGPTGNCPTCGHRYALNSNGTIRTNNLGQKRLGQLCPGSREQPRP